MPLFILHHASLGYLSVLMAAIAWSTTGLFVRIVETDPATTFALRSISGVLCTFIVVYVFASPERRRTMFIPTKMEFVASLFGLGGMSCMVIAFFYTSIANVMFVYGALPLITLLISAIVLRDKITLVGLICCLLCAFGVSLVASNAIGEDDLFGLFLAFVMTFSMASLTVITKYDPKIDVAKVTYFSAFLGAVIFLPFATLKGVGVVDALWLWLYGLLNVTMGFALFLFGVSRIPVLAGVLIGLLEIPLAPILGYILFSEMAGSQTIIGGIIILSAVIFYLITQHLSAERLKKHKYS